MTDQPREQPDAEQADEYVDLTPDGDEPTFADGEVEAEELLDKLDLGSPDDDAPAAQGKQSEELVKLQEERDAFEDKFLRAQADYQNYVRRSSRELETMRQQRVVEIARALTTVLDHFDRALEVDPEQSSAGEVLDGVASIRDEMLKALSAFGLQRVVVEPGEEFDPNRHDALMHQPHDDIDAGHVIQTFLPGYYVNDLPVRPAQVSVAQ